MDEKNGHENAPISYIFEAGDPGRSLLEEVFERDGFQLPQFMRKIPRPECKWEVFTPLQAADFLAWEHQKVYGVAERGELVGFRKSFEALSRIPHEWIVAEREHLLRQCQKAGIRRRLAK